MTQPVTLGRRIDALYQLRAKRLAAQAKVDALREAERIEEEELIGELRRAKLERASGKVATFGVSVKTVGRAVDWPSVYKWIAENDAFDLLQRRLSNPAVLERFDAGVPIDGIELTTVLDASLRKASA